MTRAVPASASALLLFALSLGTYGGALADDAPGRSVFDAFVRRQAASIAASTPRGPDRVEDRDAWRDRRRRELREMLGLEPEPARGDLRPVITGVIERPDLGIRVEKLHFQSVPGLYVTASFYRPIEAPGPLPAILYLCGHGQIKEEGISYGNKAFYQHHPTWFARHGYACLILDTLQLGEIEGKHHGTYRLGEWWWVSRGYTPGGVEAWNAIRALDYLGTRSEVDPARIGVTGRSGGGIGTWVLAALDDRPAVLAPVAGITDLQNHLITGVIDGHCDCNFLVNYHRWDFTTMAELAAPRPLLLLNTDNDRIFPLDGVLRIHAALSRAYGALEAADRLGLCIVEGPHKDTQELQVPAFRWMERWLKKKPDETIRVPAEKLLDPKSLRVLAGPPPDERNTSIEKTFVARRAAPEPPGSLEAFEALRETSLAKLRAGPFLNAPPPGAPLELTRKAGAERDGMRLDGYELLSEEPFHLALWIVSAVDAGPIESLTLSVLDDDGWNSWIGSLAGSFASELAVDPKLGDGSRAAQLKERLAPRGTALVFLAPRGVGPGRWSCDAAEENRLRRRLLVLGRMLAECQVHDVRRGVRALAAIPALASAEIRVESRGEMACVALYAAVFEPAIKELDLTSLPASQEDGPPLLGILRSIDLPEALSLVFPRRVRLRDVDPRGFEWTQKVAKMFPPGTLSVEGPDRG